MLKKSILIVFIICFIYSFLMDFFGFHGWTKTLLIDFQNERLLIYFMIFLLGSQFYKLKVFSSDWKIKKLNIIIHSTGWIPINIYIFLIIYGLINPGNYLISKIVDTAILRFNFVLSLAYLIYMSITTFKNYFNRQGKIAKELNKNSYNVYIIHVIVMGVIALAMLNTTIPSLMKFIILIVATYSISNLLAHFSRR